MKISDLLNTPLLNTILTTLGLKVDKTDLDSAKNEILSSVNNINVDLTPVNTAISNAVATITSSPMVPPSGMTYLYTSTSPNAPAGFFQHSGITPPMLNSTTRAITPCVHNWSTTNPRAAFYSQYHSSSYCPAYICKASDGTIWAFSGQGATQNAVMIDNNLVPIDAAAYTITSDSNRAPVCFKQFGDVVRFVELSNATYPGTLYRIREFNMLTKAVNTLYSFSTLANWVRNSGVAATTLSVNSYSLSFYFWIGSDLYILGGTQTSMNPMNPANATSNGSTSLLKWTYSTNTLSQVSGVFASRYISPLSNSTNSGLPKQPIVLDNGCVVFSGYTVDNTASSNRPCLVSITPSLAITIEYGQTLSSNSTYSGFYTAGSGLDVSLFPCSGGTTVSAQRGTGIYGMFKNGANTFAVDGPSRRSTVGSEYIPSMLNYTVGSDGSFSITSMFDISSIAGTCQYPIAEVNALVTSYTPIYSSGYGRLGFLNTGSAQPNMPSNYLFARYITKL